MTKKQKKQSRTSRPERCGLCTVSVRFTSDDSGYTHTHTHSCFQSAELRNTTAVKWLPPTERDADRERDGQRQKTQV